MTAADHARTVREALDRFYRDRPYDVAEAQEALAAFAALDALQTQAETAEKQEVDVARVERKRAEDVEAELRMARASRDDWERQAKGRGVVQYELLARAKAAEAERDRWKDMAELRRRRQLEAEAERDHARDALRRAQRWIDMVMAQGAPLEADYVTGELILQAARAALGDKP